jgi:hypothetical protein
MTRVLVALVLVLTLAACGGETRRAEPRLPAPVAADLATYAEDAAAFAAAGDPCAAREQAVALQRATIAAINAHRVPGALQEPLQGAVNNLLERLTCPRPAAAPVQQPSKAKGKAKGKKHKEEGD